MARSISAQENAGDFVIPYDVADPRLQDDVDTEQHKAHRGKSMHQRSIRHYRHGRTSWGIALEGFVPMWFTICISAGGLGTILNAPFPYRGRWESIVATIFYVFELTTFVLFSIVLIARWILYPRVAIRRAISDADELGSYAVPPIALMTLASLTASQVSESFWGGNSFTIVAYVMWWIGVIWTFVTAMTVLCILFYTGLQETRVATPVLFMAPMGLATAGSEAGFITINSKNMSARMAVPMLVMGYFVVGTALFMAIILYSVYLHRLMAAGWGPTQKRAGLFLIVGPCGQLATALQLLGNSAANYHRFAAYKPKSYHPPIYGTVWRQETASGIQSAGLLLALLLMGFCYLCLGLAIVGVTDVFIRRKAQFSLIWWSTIFPTATLVTAWLELSNSMDSPTFRALVCIFTVLLVVLFLINVTFTIRDVANRSLILGRSQIDIEGDLIQKAQESGTSERDNNTPC